MSSLSSPMSPTFPLRKSSFHSANSDSSTSLSSIDSDDETANAQQTRPLQPGIYVPTLTFFKDKSEDLDTSTIAQHAVRLARAGVTGITTQGSNGEAVHLSHAERQTVTRVTRQALDAAGFDEMPIIVGCGGQSTRETVQLCREACVAGGDYALILPPSYYKSLFTRDTILDFFTAVADASPIPVLIYNYPGAAAGIDLSSDDIIKLSQHANIQGCKLTCGNTGKLARIAAATKNNKSSTSSPFLTLGGSADFTLQTLIVGGHGTITGLANLAPRSCVKVFDLFQHGQLTEATKVQEVVARGDWAAISSGIVGTKSAMVSAFGYGGFCRSPLPKPSGKADVDGFREVFDEIVRFEGELEA